MNDYPEVVEKVVDDYLERTKSQLRLVAVPERSEFLREIQSHIYEAYHQESPDNDPITRILRVLRNLGEPSEVVSERLGEAMVRTGARRRFPLQIVAGVIIAVLGIPLGFAGVWVLLGALATVAGVVLAYYATAGTLLLSSVLVAAIGLSRIYQPDLWEKLLASGVVQVQPEAAALLDRLPPTTQGYILLFLGVILAATGLAMLWFGKYLIKGLRFLGALVFDWIRKLAHRARQWAKERRDAAAVPLRAAFSRFGLVR